MNESRFDCHLLGIDPSTYLEHTDQTYEALAHIPGFAVQKHLRRDMHPDTFRVVPLFDRYHALVEGMGEYASLPTAWSSLPTHPFPHLDAALEALLDEARLWMRIVQRHSKVGMFEIGRFKLEWISESVLRLGQTLAERTLRLDAWLRQSGDLPWGLRHAVLYAGPPTAYFEEDTRYRDLCAQVWADNHRSYDAYPGCVCCPKTNSQLRLTRLLPGVHARRVQLAHAWKTRGAARLRFEEGHPEAASLDVPPDAFFTEDGYLEQYEEMLAFSCHDRPASDAHRALHALQTERLEDWLSFGPMRRAFDEARAAA